MAIKEGHSLDIILFICDYCDMTSKKRIPRHSRSNNEWRPLSADLISVLFIVPSRVIIHHAKEGPGKDLLTSADSGDSRGQSGGGGPKLE